MLLLTALDWGLLMVLLASIALGAWRGLLYEVLSLLVWLFAFVAAQWLAPWVLENVLHQPAKGSGLYYAVAYVMVFIASAFIGGFLVSQLKKITDASGLRTVDRAMGAIFGTVRGTLILLVVAVLVQLTPLARHELWVQSTVAQQTVVLMHRLQPFFSDSFNAYLGS